MKNLLKKQEPIIQKIVVKSKYELHSSIQSTVDETFVSGAEICGKLQMELNQLLHFVAFNDILSVKDKLIEISTTAFIGIASINQKLDKIE